MLRVIHPGIYTIVVDFGRPHARSLGVAVGGAADRTSLAIGNALVGNTRNTPALEFSLSGPTLRAECEIGCVVYGAPFEVHTDRQNITIGRTFTLRPQETLFVGGAAKGMRAYLCVPNGFHKTPLLGSRSSLEPLEQGTDLLCETSRLPSRFVNVEWPEAMPARHLGIPKLRFLCGPQGPQFSRNWNLSKLGEPRFFRVDPASNRMGLRLAGEPLAVPEREMVSEPVCPGTVQVTREGQCVILGVDGQTIGGYPKIAQVISADIDAVGQLRPGDSVCFQEISLPEAEYFYSQKECELKYRLAKIRVVTS